MPSVLSKSAQQHRHQLALAALLLLRRIRRRRLRRLITRKSPRFWVRDIFKQRHALGQFNTLFAELMIDNDREFFYRYIRMTPERFAHLNSLVRDKIVRQNTSSREAISPEERLVVTLRFLASGDSQQSLSYSFRIGRITVSRIVSETSQAIFQSLHEYLRGPTSADEWKNIATGFEEQWNFPHVIGALDGKHVRIECPKKSGTLYHNYKSFFSLVLLAMCDADYCFTFFDLGQYGSNNDSGVLASSKMGQAFEADEINLPDAEDYDGCKFKPLPYFMLGDDIFPLTEYLLKPFPGKDLSESERIYNYRHSRARRVIENTFGILVTRFRIFSRPIKANVENAENYVLACLALHNYLRKTSNATYTPSSFVDSEDGDGNIILGDWRAEKEKEGLGGCMQEIKQVRGRRSKEEVLCMRRDLKDYFCSEEGSLEWQFRYIRRTSSNY